MTLPDESGDQIGKSQEIGWCIPHRVVADNTASNRVNQGTFPASIHIGTTENLCKSEPKIKQTVQKLLIKRQPESFSGTLEVSQSSCLWLRKPEGNGATAANAMP